MEVAGTPVKATVSLGIASTEAFGYELDTLMRRADMAVYAAKRAGRNRVDGGDARDEAPARPRDVAAAGCGSVDHDTSVAHGHAQGGTKHGSSDARRL